MMRKTFVAICLAYAVISCGSSHGQSFVNCGGMWHRYVDSSGRNDGKWYMQVNGCMHLYQPQFHAGHAPPVEHVASQKAVVKEAVVKEAVVKEVVKEVVVQEAPPVVLPPVVVAEPPISKDDWRKELLRIAAERERFLLSAKQSEADRQEFLEAVSAMGLQDVGAAIKLAPPGTYGGKYGGGNGYGGNSAYAFRDYGNTLYGYTYNSVAQPVDDPATLAQHALRLAEHFQESSERVGTKSVEIVEKVTKQQIASEDYRARLSASAALAAAAQSLLDSEREYARLAANRDHKGTQASDAKSKSIISGEEDLSFRVKAIISANCVSCHNSASPRGDVNLSLLSRLSAKQVQRIAEVVETNDRSIRMPKGRPPLPQAQIAALRAWADSMPADRR